MDTHEHLFRYGLTLSGMLLVLFLAASPSWAELECGGTVGPGEVANLTKNLTCSQSPALTLEGNSLLKLGGHTIECDESSIGIQIHGARNFLYNGTVTNCQTGIVVGGTGGHTVRWLTATGNNLGFSVSQNSNGNRLTYNTSKNGGQNGFFIESDGNEIGYNRSKEHSNVGLLAEAANGNTFKNNLATLNARGGFLFRGNDNTTSKNRAMANPTGDGFFIEGNGNKIVQNWAQNQTLGFGFVVDGDSNQLLWNNTSKNGVHGMVLLEGSEFTKVLGNRAGKTNRSEFP